MRLPEATVVFETLRGGVGRTVDTVISGYTRIVGFCSEGCDTCAF